LARVLDEVADHHGGSMFEDPPEVARVRRIAADLLEPERPRRDPRVLELLGTLDEKLRHRLLAIAHFDAAAAQYPAGSADRARALLAKARVLEAGRDLALAAAAGDAALAIPAAAPTCTDLELLADAQRHLGHPDAARE